MIDDLVGRRRFIHGSLAALAAVWLEVEPGNLAASLAHGAQARAAGPRPPWVFFTPEQAADIEAVAAQIIPTDDVPGAREAGAIYFLDHAFANWAANQGDLVRDGLAALNAAGGARFSTLPADRQLELLRAAEQTPFFQTLRFGTVVGTFADSAWGGNRDKIGWRILGFEDRFTWEPPFGDYDASPPASR